MALSEREKRWRRRAWALQCEFVWWRVRQGLPVGIVWLDGCLIPWRDELAPLERLGRLTGER